MATSMVGELTRNKYHNDGGAIERVVASTSGPGSSTFGRWYGAGIDVERREQLFIPVMSARDQQAESFAALRARLRR
jgi:hypothetical protein